MNQNLSLRIKELREKLKLGQGDMARKVGIHIQTLSRYERGKLIPSVETLTNIVDALNVNPGWLLHGTGEIFKATEYRAKIPVSPIFKRIKNALNLKNDNALAQLLGITIGRLRTSKLYNIIPYEFIIYVCIKHRLSLNWVFTGKGSAYLIDAQQEKNKDPIVHKIILSLIQLPEKSKKDVLRFIEKEILLSELSEGTKKRKQNRMEA